MNEKWLEIMKEHRIARITFREFRCRYPRLHGKNAVKTYHGFGGSVPIVQIETDQGAVGWGALCRSVAEARAAQELLLGRALSEVFDPSIGILDERMAAYDIALHDLAGVILGLSVARMLNPNAKSFVRVYDGAIYMNDIIPEERPQGIERVLRDCADDWAIGHRMFKVKIGRGHRWMGHDEGMARDVEIIHRLHRQHPGAAIMVDANDGYSVADAIHFMKQIEGVPLYWFEEPFLEEESSDRELHRFLDIERPGTLIADGENKPNIPQLLDLASQKLVDVLQPDVCGFGFTAWRKLMPVITANGYLASPHAWGDVVKTNYCAHLAAAWPHHVPCIEAVLGISEGVDDSGYVLEESMLTVPNKPGFGMELLWAPEIP